MLGLILSLVFLVLALITARENALDALVLVVVAATYFKGWRKGSRGYLYAATILAVIFATLCLLILIANVIDAVVTGESLELKLNPGIVGFITLPLLLKKF